MYKNVCLTADFLFPYFQIDRIEMTLPNVHYIDVDYSRFPKLEFSGCSNQVRTALSLTRVGGTVVVRT